MAATSPALSLPGLGEKGGSLHDCWCHIFRVRDEIFEASHAGDVATEAELMETHQMKTELSAILAHMPHVEEKKAHMKLIDQSIPHEEFMQAVKWSATSKFFSSNPTHNTTSNSTPLHLNQTKVCLATATELSGSDASPTNVADLITSDFSLPLTYTQTPRKLSSSSPKLSPARLTAFIPKRRLVAAASDPEPDAPRSKRRRKETNDTDARDTCDQSSQTPRPTLPVDYFKSPERALCKDYNPRARGLFSPGQTAAQQLVALRHAFSPCKKEKSRCKALNC